MSSWIEDGTVVILVDEQYGVAVGEGRLMRVADPWIAVEQGLVDICLEDKHPHEPRENGKGVNASPEDEARAAWAPARDADRRHNADQDSDGCCYSGALEAPRRECEANSHSSSRT